MGKYEEDNSLYNDGEDKKPKLVIIIASIIGALILILIFAFACTKLNKKSSNSDVLTIFLFLVFLHQNFLVFSIL